MGLENKQNLQLIGKVKDAHGLKGELLVIVFSKDYSPWLKMKEFHLAVDDKSEPRLVKVVSIREANLGLIVRLSELSDRTQAEKLRGQLVYIHPDLLKSKVGERIFLREILNFQVFDKNLLVGTVTGFSSNGPQDILLVQVQNDALSAAPSASQSAVVEIPFVEAFIEKLDMQARTIHMILPEGLIEVNFASEGSHE